MSLGAPPADATVLARGAGNAQPQSADAATATAFAALLAIALAPVQTDTAKLPSALTAPDGLDSEAQLCAPQCESDPVEVRVNVAPNAHAPSTIGAVERAAPSIVAAPVTTDPARMLMMLSFALRDVAAAATPPVSAFASAADAKTATAAAPAAVSPVSAFASAADAKTATAAAPAAVSEAAAAPLVSPAAVLEAAAAPLVSPAAVVPAPVPLSSMRAAPLAPSTYVRPPAIPAEKIEGAAPARIKTPVGMRPVMLPLTQLAPELRARVERVLARAAAELGHTVEVIDVQATEAPLSAAPVSPKGQSRTLESLMRIAREEGLDTYMAAPDEAAAMFEAVGVGTERPLIAPSRTMPFAPSRPMLASMPDRVTHFAETRGVAARQHAEKIPAPMASELLDTIDLGSAVSALDTPVIPELDTPLIAAPAMPVIASPGMSAIPMMAAVPITPMAAAPSPSTPVPAANASDKIARVPESRRTVIGTRGAPPEPQDTAASPDEHNRSVATRPITFAGGVDANVADLVPAFRGKLERVVDRMHREFGYDVQVVETYRGQDRQNQLFAQGRTAPGDVVTWTRASKHTAARAADVVIDGTFDNPIAYTRLAQVAKEEGLRTLGARDPGHLELPFADGDNAIVSADVTSVATGSSARGAATKIAMPFTPVKVASATAPAQPATVAQLATVAQVAAVAPPAASVVNVARATSVDKKSTTITRNMARTAASIVTPVSVPRTASPARIAASVANTDAPRGAAAPALPEKREAGDGRDSTAPASARQPSVTTATGEIAPRVQRGAAAPAAAAVDVAAGTTRMDPASHVAHLLDTRESSRSSSLSQVVLRLDDGQGGEDRIRVGLRGTSVGASIDLRDASQVERLTSRLGELQQSLERRGLDAESLRVRNVAVAGAPVMDEVTRSTGAAASQQVRDLELLRTSASSMSDGASTPDRERGQGQQSQSSARDDARQGSHTSDDPRQRARREQKGDRTR